MKNKVLISITIIVIVTIFFACSCSRNSNEYIKIGSVLVLSGDGAVYGIESSRGMNLALDEINASGGVKGEKIKIIYEDSQGTPSIAVSAAQKLIFKDKVPVILGAMYSSETLAVAPFAEKNKVVLFSPSSSSPKVTSAGDYIFRNWPSDNLEASVMADFSYNRLQLRKIGILWVKNDYGEGLESVFKNKFLKLGGKILTSEAYLKDATDYRAQLLKIKSTHPQALYLPGYYNEIGQILKQAKQVNLKVIFLSCVSFEDPKVLDIAGDAAEGVIYGVPAYDPMSKDKLVQNFAKRFKEKYGTIPGAFAAHGYDALKIVAKAIENGGYNSYGIKNALYNIKDFPGVTGLTSIDKNGDVIKPIRIKVVRKMKFVYY